MEPEHGVTSSWERISSRRSPVSSKKFGGRMEASATAELYEWKPNPSLSLITEKPFGKKVVFKERK